MSQQTERQKAVRKHFADPEVQTREAVASPTKKKKKKVSKKK